MDVPVLADQQELIYISSVQTQDVVWRTRWEGWGEREREREREFGKSMLSAQLDDNEDLLSLAHKP